MPANSSPVRDGVFPANLDGQSALVVLSSAGGAMPGSVVPVDGDCEPSQDSLDLAWVTPDEAAALAALGDMGGGHGVLLRQALAHLGHPI